LNNLADKRIRHNPETVIGLDIGSSYIKAISLNTDLSIAKKHLIKTGYNYSSSIATLLERFEGQNPIIGVTGYGRHQWKGEIQKTEITALAKGMVHLGISDGTLIDIGGQDSKVLKLEKGKLIDHALNKRCAAGTGSYLEYIAFRMEMDIARMNQLAEQDKETGIQTLNSFCTVFAGTEILDHIKNKIPLPSLIRGLYASIADRIREIAPLTPPVFLSGGVIAHHPALLEVFKKVLGNDIQVMPNPQYLAALGIAIYTSLQ